MNLRGFIICFIALVYTNNLTAQEFSNKGKDFWLGYGFHVRMINSPGQNSSTNNLNAQDLILYLTSDQNANVTVEIPGLGYSRQYTVVANQVTISDPIPKSGSQDARIIGPGKFNSGIHIFSDRPVVAYAHIYNQSISGASLLFPTNTLGKDYYSINYTQRSNEQNAHSFFFIVATEDSTTVEITPSDINLNNLTPLTPNIISLNKGEIYSVMGVVSGNYGSDLTGSKIRSISTGTVNGGCKPIAVFSGSGKINIGGTPQTSADNLFAQAFPSNAWGNKYLTAPTGSQPNNYYRVCVKDPNTKVWLNGNLLTDLNNQFYYEFKNGGNGGNPIPNIITADNPILVAQYCTSQSQEGNPSAGGGDPEMIYLSPVEQTINKITLFSASQFLISNSFINVIIKNEGINSFTLDGVSPLPGSFILHPGDNSYSYAILSVSSGRAHSLYSDSGFNAIAYGFGAAESYGYNAGTNIIDLNPPIKIKNDYASSGIRYSATCTNTPFKMYISVPYTANKLVVDFGPNTNLKGPNPYTYLPNGSLIGGADSSYTFNGKSYYVYYIPKSFEFKTAGSFPVKITASATTTISDGCSSNNEQVIEDNIEVNQQPIADFSIISDGCVNSPITFSDETNAFGSSTYKWFWDFGNGILSNEQHPIINLNNYTTIVKFRSITDYGCVTDTVKTIQLSDKPIAKFDFTSPNCIGTKIDFIDQSTYSNSSNNNIISNWIWSFDNGTSPDSLLTNATQTRQFNTEGNKNNFLKVRSTTGCASDTYQPLFAIKPTPQVKFSTPKICLADAFATFIDNSIISDNTASNFIYNWTFNSGLPDVSNSKNPSIQYQTPGKYNAQLKVTAINGCTDSLSKEFFVNASDPKAAFEVQNSDPICLPSAVRIKNKSTLSVGNITKIEVYWDFINHPEIKDEFEDPRFDTVFTHQYPDLQQNNPQAYTIRFIAFSGGGSCTDYIESTIKVYPQPKAKIDQSVNQICAGDKVSFKDLTDGLTGVPVKWKWDFGRLGNETNNSFQKTFIDSGNVQFTFFIINASGCNSDTISADLDVFANPTVKLPNQISLILGNKVQLIPEVTGTELSYFWSPGSQLDDIYKQNPWCTATDDITYSLKVSGKGGCSASDEVFILVLKPPEMPNAFSPNGDGINDYWIIKNINRYPDASIDVFDRYNQKVFHSDNYSTPWDGKFNQKPLPIGTYYFVINPKNGLNTMSGSVTIIN